MNKSTSAGLKLPGASNILMQLPEKSGNKEADWRSAKIKCLFVRLNSKCSDIKHTSFLLQCKPNSSDWEWFTIVVSPDAPCYLQDGAFAGGCSRTNQCFASQLSLNSCFRSTWTDVFLIQPGRWRDFWLSPWFHPVTDDISLCFWAMHQTAFLKPLLTLLISPWWCEGPAGRTRSWFGCFDLWGNLFVTVFFLCETRWSPGLCSWKQPRLNAQNIKS